jgi:hypothetical protein
MGNRKDVFAYFDKDAYGFAIKNALTLPLSHQGRGV